MDDGRSNKVAFLAHCFINSNSMAEGVGAVKVYPAMIDEVINLLREKKIGIVQMRCPEQESYGWIRAKRTKADMGEDFRVLCKEIAAETTEQMRNYIDAGFEVVFIAGKRGSPACGYKETWAAKGELKPEKGVFFEELDKALKEKRINVYITDFEKDEPEQCIAELRRVIG